MTANKLHRQIVAARKEVRKLKEAAPYMFQEYLDLIRAGRDLEVAEDKYQTALKRWEAI